MQRFLVISFALMFSVFSSPAYAQLEDFGDILEDIINGSKIPGQTPIYGESSIETIPVSIRYDVPSDLDGHMLIISAFIPNDPSGIKTKPRLLGQTQILLDGLKQPLQLVIAVPETVTRDLTFSRITAEIRDANNNRVMINEREGLYRGSEPPEITLIATGQNFTPPQTLPISGFEIVSGEVHLSGNQRLPRGGTLTIQLLENSLAGGTSLTIAAEDTISIDQQFPPFKFTLDKGITSTDQDTPLAIKAWVTDWAGRKTHIIRKPVPYNGPETNYKLTLDTLTQGLNTRAGQNLDPTLMAQSIVHGEAVFDPSNGMPGGARLTATLNKAVGAFGDDRVLSQQTIIVNSNINRVAFSLSTASTNFDPLIPSPILSLEIVDSRGNIFYDSGDIQARDGAQTVQLYPRRNF